MSEARATRDIEQNANDLSLAGNASEAQDPINATGETQQQHQSETCDGVSQPAAAINARQDNEEWEGRRQSNEADEIVASSGEGDTRSSGKPGSVATEPNGKDGANEQKLARRKRRCPVVKIEEYLYNNGEDEGESKVDGRSDKRSLARLVMEEDLVGFLRLVQEGAACIWDSDGHGWTALHWACSRGSTALTYAILQEMQWSKEAGADCDGERTEDAPNSCNQLDLPEKLSGWSPLHLAVIGGHLTVVYLLMEAGCDPFVKDKSAKLITLAPKLITAFTGKQETLDFSTKPVLYTPNIRFAARTPKVGDRPIDCIKRTKDRGGLVRRLRNALLDLSDTEGSGCDESTVSPLCRGNKEEMAAPSQPLRRKGPSRERNRRR